MSSATRLCCSLFQQRWTPPRKMAQRCLAIDALLGDMKAKRMNIEPEQVEDLGGQLTAAASDLM